MDSKIFYYAVVNKPVLMITLFCFERDIIYRLSYFRLFVLPYMGIFPMKFCLGGGGIFHVTPGKQVRIKQCNIRSIKYLVLCLKMVQHNSHEHSHVSKKLNSRIIQVQVKFKLNSEVKNHVQIYLLQD